MGEPGAVDGDEPQLAGVTARVVVQPAVARAREHLGERHPGVGLRLGRGGGPAAQEGAAAAAARP